VIESVRIDDEGPDGTYLIIDTDTVVVQTLANRRYAFPVTDDALRELDAALQPFRDHWAEAEAIRGQVRAHRGAGYCTGWVNGEGPCGLPYGHEGSHESSPFSRKV
jgi:hypothetical protein